MFVSNTPTSTSHNMKIVLQKGEARTFRVLLRPVEAGALTWRFRFHNGVDSTWDDGSESWEGLPGGRFEIVSTSVCAEADGALGAFAPVTWGGAAGRAVGPDEWAVSDPVALEVAPGGEITGYRIRTPQSKLTTVKALQSVGFDTIACGDSYNDLGMIRASKAGFLFRSTERIKADNPDLPAFEAFDDLRDAIFAAL